MALPYSILFHFLSLLICASQGVQTSDDKIAAFENWLAKFGVTQTLDIVEGAEGYGKITVAKQAIKVDGVVTS